LSDTEETTLSKTGGGKQICATKTWEKLDGLVRNTRENKYVKYTPLVLGHHKRWW